MKSVQRTCVTPFAAANRTHAIHHKNGVEPSGRVVRQETQGCRTVVALNSTRRSLLAGALLIAPTLGTSPGSNASCAATLFELIALSLHLHLKRGTPSWAEEHSQDFVGSCLQARGDCLRSLCR